MPAFRVYGDWAGAPDWANLGRRNSDTRRGSDPGYLATTHSFARPLGLHGDCSLPRFLCAPAHNTTPRENRAYLATLISAQPDPARGQCPCHRIPAGNPTAADDLSTPRPHGCMIDGFVTVAAAADGLAARPGHGLLLPIVDHLAHLHRSRDRRGTRRLARPSAPNR